MFTRADIKALSIAAASAVTAGLAFGVWAAPPAHLSEPVIQASLQPIYADDPNLARYKQVIAEQGGPGPLYIVTGYPAYAPAPDADRPDAAAARAVDAELARQAAELEAEDRAWAARRAAWIETRRQAEAALPASYAAPEDFAHDEPQAWAHAQGENPLPVAAWSVQPGYR